jgi:hypothetical protein
MSANTKKRWIITHIFNSLRVFTQPCEIYISYEEKYISSKIAPYYFNNQAFVTATSYPENTLFLALFIKKVHFFKKNSFQKIW